MSTPAQYRKRLVKRWTLFVTGVLALGGVMALDSHHKHQTIEAEERVRLMRQLDLVSTTLGQNLQTTSNVLDVVRRSLPAAGAVAGAPLNQRLADMVVAHPGVKSMLVVDVRGTVVASSRPELLGINFYQSERYQAIAQHPDLQRLYVSAPFVTPLGNYAIGLCKMVPGPDGAFNGYVMAILAPSFFARLLESILYATDVAGWVVHGDGQVVHRSPGPQKYVGINVRQNPESLFSRFLATGQQRSFIEGTGSLTGERYLTAMGVVWPEAAQADKPLLVSVSRNSAAVFAAWHEDRKLKLTIFATVALAGLFGMLMYQQRRVAYDALRRLNLIEHERAETQLRDSESRFRGLFEHLPVPYQSLDGAGCWLDANQPMAALLGFESPAQMLGQDFSTFWEEPYRSRFGPAYDEFKRKHQVDGELALRRRDGKLITVLISGRIQCDARGNFLRTHCILVDISERRALEEHILQLNEELESRVAQRTRELALANEELERLARQDALTGLPNRRVATERLAAEFQAMRRTGAPYAVLMLDIDFFKRVNDTWGHEVGDQVLKRLAQVLRASVRATDLAARLGGEEFVVLLPDTPLEAALSVAEKIRQAVQAASDPVAGTVTVSIGVALASPQDRNEDDVLRRADAGLYAAKSAGRNRVVAQSSSVTETAQAS